MNLLSRLLDCIRSLGKDGPRDQALPPRILILLTNPRSGSTWLFDALRCHPAIYVHRSAAVYRSLGLHGRRYPRDLSRGPQGALEVEVLPGQWDRIPSFDVSDHLDGMAREALPDRFAIEKIHPQFFQFDASGFLEDVKELDRQGVELRFVYQVRDPRASIGSFLSYQKRNPSWYPNTKDEQLASYMSRTYDAILAVAERCPGLVVDYADTVDDLEAVLREIFLYLWPAATPREAEFASEVSRAAVKATSREKRAEAGSSFLGKQVGPVKGTSDGQAAFSMRFADEMAQCYESYKALLSLEERT